MTTELRPHEIEREIGDRLSCEAADWWAGTDPNEMIIYAQRHGLEAAVAEIEELAKKE